MDVLQHGEFHEGKYAVTYFRKDRHHISGYAALGLGFLGDPDAVGPLVNALRKDRCEWAIYSLTRLRDVKAIKPIIEYASDQSRLDYNVHRCLEYISRARLPFKYFSDTRTYEAVDFPEIGKLDCARFHATLWQHWLKEGDKTAGRQFHDNYVKWRLLQKERPDDRSSRDHVLRNAFQQGVLTLPYVMREIEKGDESLIPFVSEMTAAGSRRETRTGRELPANANREDCLKWWEANKDRWTILSVKE
jgi:hypothetical protein